MLLELREAKEGLVTISGMMPDYSRGSSTRDADRQKMVDEYEDIELRRKEHAGIVRELMRKAEKKYPQS